MNLLLCTDVYKMGHMEQYPEGTTQVYSYLTTRSDKKYDKAVFYGLQYYMYQYLQHGISREDVDEFLLVRKSILGIDLDEKHVQQLYRLANLGYLPLQIKAVPEGTIMEKFNVMMTVTNTHPDYAWLVGFLESLLLKVWNTCTVATASLEYKKVAEAFADRTCDRAHLPFAVHDFGYRGVSSEETAALSGSAHLLNFLGTDTVPAVKFVREFYRGTQSHQPIGLSVPATEHCVMCVHGKDMEFETFEYIIDTYPSEAIISIVSGTYDFWNVMTNFAPRLKEKILARSGKIVFRPDSGDPVQIVCGSFGRAFDQAETPEEKGALALLEETFGSTKNSKGFKLLNPKVGLIYGDGMYLGRYRDMLNMMEYQGWASSNLVIGVGGLLLQQHSRDDLGFAFKATYCVVNDERKEVWKNPVTDPGKKSHKGLLRLEHDGHKFVTYDEQTEEQEDSGLLQTVFRNGEIKEPQSFEGIRSTLDRNR